ncbi:MAG: hypothetical protein RL662_148 [Bacteroidota bacterium]|jgi:hypothetical protein
MKFSLSLFFSFFVFLGIMAQQSRSIQGVVIDKGSREVIPYASLLLQGASNGVLSDSLGFFSFDNLPPGAYTLQVSSLGYRTLLTPQYLITTRNVSVTVELDENINQLKEVSVAPSPFRRVIESPVSLHVIGIQEIEKSPGANRDISRIVQSYPGVSFSPAGYRNDLVVRGGGPSENRFFLDEVEIPNINHFSTQGASGGPVGLINADLIREVNFYTGAFPASGSNSLSSVLDFKLKDGNINKKSLKGTLGASEFSLASDGYLNPKTSYVVSVRQSYLQFLFDLLGLPFLPTYTDAQFKLKTKLAPSHELMFMGLGGIDKMRLNDKATSEDAEYILGYLPKIKQETFTLGSVYKHYNKTHTQTVVLSHSYSNNSNEKFENNETNNPDKLILDYTSREQETKLRAENLMRLGSLKLNAGTNLDYMQYTNTTFQRLYLNNASAQSRYHTSLSFLRWGVFATLGYISADERLTGSFGIRSDAAGYSSKMSNILKQISPRLSLSYKLVDNFYLSANGGRYYQLPPLTSLGFKDQDGVYVNKQLRYMRADQVSSGISYRVKNNIELSVEGFYKKYNNMPLSVQDSIPLMSKGNDYGVIGNELLTSSAQGRSYGVEFLARWIVPQKVNVMSSFTLYKSEYKNSGNTDYIASAWDNGYILNISGTYYLPKNWSVGMKIRSIGGGSYTPYDVQKSSLVSAWDVQGRAYLDYSQFNTKRSSSYTQLDLRVDKTLYIKRYMLGFYIDIQNLTGSEFKEQDAIVSTGAILNPSAPTDQHVYEMKYLKRTSSTIVPTIGITFEF